MIKTTNLRLNLDKPDHRKAYDILKSSDMSYSNTIVAALISFSENEENRKTLLDGIRKIVREEIGTFFQNADSEQIGNLSEIRISENISAKLKHTRIKLIILALFSHEVLMVAPLDDTSVFHDHNDVRILYSR